MTEVEQLKRQLHYTRWQRDTVSNQLVDALVKIDLLAAEIAAVNAQVIALTKPQPSA